MIGCNFLYLAQGGRGGARLALPRCEGGVAGSRSLFPVAQRDEALVARAPLLLGADGLGRCVTGLTVARVWIPGRARVSGGRGHGALVATLGGVVYVCLPDSQTRVSRVVASRCSRLLPPRLFHHQPCLSQSILPGPTRFAGPIHSARAKQFCLSQSHLFEPQRKTKWCF